jgi:hypothetical protein
MKPVILTASLFFTLFLSSCLFSHKKGGLSIKVRESDNFYSMEAHFNEAKTRQVQEYMDKSLADGNNMSFVNTETDAMITLDDHTRFYIKSFAGELKIKFDKRENSVNAYKRVKSMCEELKGIIGEN